MKNPVGGDRYRVEREVVRGGGGVVYEARDRLLHGRKVALKVAPGSRKGTLAAALKNEFSLLTSLRHRHLARVLDFGVTDRESYITSEWIEGRNLLEATRKANLNTVFRLLLQTLRAVDYLHRRGVLHLDLKPPNILVTQPDGTGEACVKLIDFGLSEWRRGDFKSTSEFRGTVPYAAPELLAEQPATPASDLYAIGMILHQVFAGRFPFENDDPLELMRRQIYGEPSRINDLPPALPRSFGDLLLRSVARDPAARFRSAAEMLSGINACLNESFTLRSPTAPVRILEESDRIFREEAIDELVAALRKSPRVLAAGGPEGVGKTRFLRRVKELLQLEGVHALLFQDRESWGDYARTLPQDHPPILLDLVADGAAKTVLLEPLASEMILDFLKHEIADFPAAAQGAAVARLGEGLPAKLETVLQAIREEGWIQWTDRGWRWIAPNAVVPEDLIERQTARWEDRRREVEGILRLPLAAARGLPADVLEGLVGLEPGVLEDRLDQWVREGRLESRAGDGRDLYALRETPEETAPDLPEDWDRIRQRLAELYDRGMFAQGAQWTDALVETRTPSGIPVDIALSCGRHLLAINRAETAARLLPPRPPANPAQRGLFYELRGRVRDAEGRIKPSFGDYEAARKAYEAVGDTAGVARSLNLMGISFKKTSHFDEAEGAFVDAAEAARRISYPYLEGLAVMNRATLYHDQGQFARASRTYEEALDAAARARHPFLECLIRHNRVNLLFHTGHTNESEKECYEWLHLALENRFAEQQAAALNYLALQAGQEGNRRRQLDDLNQAIEILQAHGGSPLLPQILVNRGYLAWSDKRFVAAQIDGERALELAETGAWAQIAATARLLLGKVLRDRPRPDLDEASALFDRAYREAEPVRNRQILWECLFERGLLEKKRADVAEARSYFLAARRELENLLEEMPEPLKRTFLRDRKLEKIEDELNG